MEQNSDVEDNQPTVQTTILQNSDSAMTNGDLSSKHRQCCAAPCSQQLSARQTVRQDCLTDVATKPQHLLMRSGSYCVRDCQDNEPQISDGLPQAHASRRHVPPLSSITHHELACVNYATQTAAGNYYSQARESPSLQDDVYDCNRENTSTSQRASFKHESHQMLPFASDRLKLHASTCGTNVPTREYKTASLYSYNAQTPNTASISRQQDGMFINQDSTNKFEANRYQPSVTDFTAHSQTAIDLSRSAGIQQMTFKAQTDPVGHRTTLNVPQMHNVPSGESNPTVSTQDLMSTSVNVNDSLTDRPTGCLTDNISLKSDPLRDKPFTSYRAINWQPVEAKYDQRIIRISACRRKKPHTLYRVHFNDKTKPQWFDITKIPPDILANFYATKFQMRKKRKYLMY
jgi:hypothetical protein